MILDDSRQLLYEGVQPTRRSFRQFFNTVWNGPVNPQNPQVSIIFPRLQLLPARLNRVSALKKWCFFCMFLSFWLISNITIARGGLLASMNDQNVEVLFPGENPSVWMGPNEKCGLNGQNCWSTYKNSNKTEIESIMNFKCPANFEHNTWTYKPWPVGNQTIMRQPVVIGGPDVYRGDSFICAAAFHSGVLSKYRGGCGRLQWLGSKIGFNSTLSVDRSFTSFSFDSEFPRNFRFIESPNFLHCRDLTLITIIANAGFILTAAYLLVSPPAFLTVLSIFGFWTVILTNPPWKGGNSQDNSEFISSAFQRFFPCLLGLFYIYNVATEPQLTKMPANLSRSIFWGGGFLLGINEHIVFSRLPLDRLLFTDIKSQSGAWFTYGVIFVVFSGIIICQSYSFWLCGRLKYYLKLYAAVIFVLICLSCLPNLTVRIHHYILALILLPGTSLQSSCSLFYQGLLVGLYISGVARWNFDSILQTSDQLNRGDIPRSEFDPYFLSPLYNLPNNFVVQWKWNPTHKFNGFSLIINDIERARIPAELGKTLYTFNLTHWVNQYWPDTANRPMKMYLRIAAATFSKKHDTYSKFSSAMIAYLNGTYTL